MLKSFGMILPWRTPGKLVPCCDSRAIRSFVDRLAAAPAPPSCENFYSYQRPFARLRRHNLERYFRLIALQRPDYLLVGEAPGYRGCRLTGIPFVSPQILADLGHTLGQNDIFLTVPEWPHLWREASATIVWRTIRQWQPLPLLWNVLPFHPHKVDQPQSNRTPTTREIDAGRPFLAGLMELFHELKVVAVGQKAATALRRWKVSHTAVRHPSHGGATQFQAALQTLQKNGGKILE